MEGFGDEANYWSGLWDGHRVNQDALKESVSWSLALFANDDYPSALGASLSNGASNVIQGRWNPRTKQVLRAQYFY